MSFWLWFLFLFSLLNILWCSSFQHAPISGKHFPVLVWRHLFYLDPTSSQLTLPLGRCPEGQLFSQLQLLASETHTQATFGPSQESFLFLGCQDLLLQLWYAMLWSNGIWVQIKWVWVSRHYSNLRILKQKNPQWYLLRRCHFQIFSLALSSLLRRHKQPVPSCALASGL